MGVYKTNGLTSAQQIHKEVFCTPKGSLTRLAVNKIEWFEEFENTRFERLPARIIKRVITVAMPIIAAIDAFCFLGKAIFKAVTLKPRDAIYDLLRCGESLKLFFVSIPAALVAVFSPVMVYRNEERWTDIMRKQIHGELVETYESKLKKCLSEQDLEPLKEQLLEKLQEEGVTNQIIGEITEKNSLESLPKNLEAILNDTVEDEKKRKEVLTIILAFINKEMVKYDRESMETCLGKIVRNEEAKTEIGKVIDEIIRQIPKDDHTKSEKFIEEYFHVYAGLLVNSVTHETPLDKTGEPFIDLVIRVIKMRKPNLRLPLLFIVSNTYSKSPEIFNRWKELRKTLNNKHHLSLFLVNLMTDDNALIDGVKEVLSCQFFKDKPERAKFISVLVDLEASELSLEGKKNALEELIVCRKKDAEITITLMQKKKEVAPKDKNKIKKLKKQQTRKENLLKKKNKALEDAKNKEKQNEQQITALNNNIEKVKGEIEALKNQIKEMETNGSNGNIKQGEGLQVPQNWEPSYYTRRAIENLGTLLSLQKPELMVKCLDEIGKGKRFGMLSDQGIITYLFELAYDVDEFDDKTVFEDEKIKKIVELRAPYAFIALHSRLKGLRGREREKALEASRNFLSYVVNGTLWEERHNEEHSRHLMKIFTECEGLKEKWMAEPLKCKVSDLVPNASERYKDFEVFTTKCPCDLLLLGSDLNTCVNLQGRLILVKGLLAYMLDGKLHTVVAKKDEDGPLHAEVQLQLMWDDKNNKAVLFLEQVNCCNANDGDETLVKAVIEYCKKEAKRLGLDLVTIYNDNERQIINMGMKKYRGKVKSLGCVDPVPVEFVNVFANGLLFPRTNGVYDLGKTYLLQAAGAG